MDRKVIRGIVPFLRRDPLLEGRPRQRPFQKPEGAISRLRNFLLNLACSDSLAAKWGRPAKIIFRPNSCHGTCVTRNRKIIFFWIGFRLSCSGTSAIYPDLHEELSILEPLNHVIYSCAKFFLLFSTSGITATVAANPSISPWPGTSAFLLGIALTLLCLKKIIFF